MQSIIENLLDAINKTQMYFRDTNTNKTSHRKY